jgi:hypothetical protein
MAENIYNTLFTIDRTILENDFFLTTGFERNRLTCANVLNLEFLFDDAEANPLEINRYFGFFVNAEQEGTFRIDPVKAYLRSKSDNQTAPATSETFSNKNEKSYTVTGSNVAGDNAWKLLTSISGAFATDQVNYSFQSRNSIVRTSAHYFVRVKNTEYNFSNNPTYVTGSEGEFSQPTFLNDPTVYITTVGMYNDRQELLAVGKLSQPIQKSFSKESLIKVRLDF